MYNLVKQSDEELRIIFRNTAQKMELHESIIEKDFWVCLTLDFLFHQCKWKDSFIFKGGTSLSKCYNLIQRFSEDIDLILNWCVLGYEFKEPWEKRSKTKQNTFNKEANKRAEEFLATHLLPTLKKDMSEVIGKTADLYILPEDPQTICFKYPRIFETTSILQVIRLEIGALAAWTPACEKTVTAYVAECYPKAFSKISSQIPTAASERTFWEKATILHHEAHRPENSPMPNRYSRHYYDLYCIAHSDNKEDALSKLNLLRRVVEFKMNFYPRNWAHYEDAKPGTLKLVPPAYRMEELRQDYESMQNMIFGKAPDFDVLMEYIKELEEEINSLPIDKQGVFNVDEGQVKTK